MKDKEILDGFNALGLSEACIAPYLGAEQFARAILPCAEPTTVYFTTGTSTSQAETIKGDDNA
jgi:hypothetical protein